MNKFHVGEKIWVYDRGCKPPLKGMIYDLSKNSSLVCCCFDNGDNFNYRLDEVFHRPEDFQKVYDLIIDKANSLYDNHANMLDIANDFEVKYKEAEK